MEYIKRKYLAELELLKKEIFVTKPDTIRCATMCGPTGVGKSTLVRQWIEEWDAEEKKTDVCLVYVDLKEISETLEPGFWAFWKIVLKACKEKADLTQKTGLSKRRIGEATEYILNRENEKLCSNPDAEVYLKLLFESYAKLQFRVILVIDHFEYSACLFPQEEDKGFFYQTLFFYSNKGSIIKKGLNILLLSNGAVDTIAHHMAKGSIFSTAYPEVHLDGLFPDEMDCYYTVFPDISESQKERITWYCGKHPLLLEKMHEMILNHGEETEYDIDQLYLKYGEALESVYSDFYERIKHAGYLEKLLACQENEENRKELYLNCFMCRELHEGMMLHAEKLPEEAESNIKFGLIAPYLLEYIRCEHGGQ